MPDGVVYWFGYQSANMEIISTSTGWTLPSGVTSFKNPVFNTNYASMSTSESQSSGIAYKGKIPSGYTKVKTYGQTTVGSPVSLINYGAKQTVLDAGSRIVGSTLGIYGRSDITVGYYTAFIAQAGRSANCYALWLE